jgi:hypothetical protein
MTVPIQDYFPKTTEMRFILPVKRVADRTHTVREDTLSSASAVHHPLSSLLHAFTPGSPRPMYLYIVSRVTPSSWASRGKPNIAVTGGNLSPGLLIVAEQELCTDGLWSEARRVDRQSRGQVQPEAAIGIDVAVD